MRKSFYYCLMLGIGISLSACQTAFTQPPKQPAPSSQAALITVIKDTGAKQCSIDFPTSLSKAQQQLAAQKINATGGQCIRQKGISFTTVCGATAGIFNAFKIPKSQLAQAQQIGFQQVPPDAIENTDCPRH